MSKRLPLLFCLAVITLAALPAAAQSPVVHINGPTAIEVSKGCYTASWDANVSGGAAPFAYAWDLDGMSLGSNPSASKQYCSTSGVCSNFSDVLTVDVTDFNGRETTDSMTITIKLRGCDANGLNCVC